MLVIFFYGLIVDYLAGLMPEGFLTSYPESLVTLKEGKLELLSLVWRLSLLCVWSIAIESLLKGCLLVICLLRIYCCCFSGALWVSYWSLSSVKFYPLFLIRLGKRVPFLREGLPRPLIGLASIPFDIEGSSDVLAFTSVNPINSSWESSFTLIDT